MKLIVGLGNPGKKYESTRHNAGALFCDYVQESLSADPTILWVKKEQEFGIWHQTTYKGDAFTILIPKTFMNDSGRAVSEIVSFYKIPVTDVCIAHDDLDIKLGEYKIQHGKGPLVHNGVNSIETALKSKDFWRIRIGIDNRDIQHRVNGEEYVLSPFPREEKELLPVTFRDIMNTIFD